MMNKRSMFMITISAFAATGIVLANVGSDVATVQNASHSQNVGSTGRTISTPPSPAVVIGPRLIIPTITSNVKSGSSNVSGTRSISTPPSPAIVLISTPPSPAVVFAPTPISVHPITTSNGQTSL